MPQKNKKRTIIAIIIVLLLAFLIFSHTVLFAVIRAQLNLVWISKASPRNPVMYYNRIDENLAIDIMGINYSVDGSTPSAIPILLLKDDNGWKAISLNENTKLLFSDRNRTLFFVFNTFVEQIGEYTIICIGSDYMTINELTAKDFYDNLGTEAIWLSHEIMGKSATWGNWAQFVGRIENGSVWDSSKDLSDYGYFFIIKDMPDGYELHIGNVVVTAQDIRDKFIS